MTLNLARKTISSAKLIQLINDSREQEAAAGIASPAKNFGFVDQEAIRHKARELGIKLNASTSRFSQPDAQEIASSYGPIANGLVADFFYDQDMPIDVVAKEVQEIKPVQSSTVTMPATSGSAVPVMMSSIQLLELVNQVRIEFAEKPVRRHNDFLARCKDELDGGLYETFVEPAKTTATGRIPAFEAIRMTADQCKLVAMRESKGVRRRVLARLNELEAQQASPIEQKLNLLLEQNKKLEAIVLRLSSEIEAIKVAQPAPTLLQQPASAPKRRTKNPERAPGPLGWQIGKKTKSIRFSFTVAPHEIGLEHFYYHLQSLSTDIERAEAVRTAIKNGIWLDTSKPLTISAEDKTIRFKITISETDQQLQGVLDMLYPLATDKERRIALKRYIAEKSAKPFAFAVAATPAAANNSRHPGQPYLF